MGDGGGGGGDLGGGGGFGGGGGGDGTTSNFGGFGDPNMFPGSMGDTGGLGLGDNTYAAASGDQGGGYNYSGAPYADMSTPGGIESPVPPPGQTATSIGGQQSGAPQQGQGYGGGSPTQQPQQPQQGSQQGSQLQQLIQQLTKLGQGGPAGPSNLSPTLPQLASRGDVTSDAAPPGLGSTGAVDPTATASTSPTGNVPIGTTAQPIPPSDSTTPAPPMATSPGQPPPAGASPEETAAADTAAQPAPTPAATPAAKPAAAAATPAPAADADPSKGPPGGTSGGQGQGQGQGYGGGSPQQQQQLNPGKIIGDVIQAMFGNPQPLLEDLAGQAGGAQPWKGSPQAPASWGPAPQPGDPRYGHNPPGTGPERGTGTGRRGRTGRAAQPQAPAAKPEPPAAEETTATTSPGQEPPPGSTTQATRLITDRNQAAAQAQRIKNMPASTHAQNFNQPFNQQLKQERQSRFARELANPAVKQQIFRVMGNEQDSNPQGTQGVFESLINRASISGRSLLQEAQWVSGNGYYADGTYGAGSDPRVLEQSYRNVMNGSNITNYATDNSSEGKTNYASRQMNRGKFSYQADYNGEYFQAPQRSGNFSRKAWQDWVNKMQGGVQGPLWKIPGAGSSLQTPNRAAGADLLRGNTQTASLETGDTGAAPRQESALSQADYRRRMNDYRLGKPTTGEQPRVYQTLPGSPRTTPYDFGIPDALID